MNICEAEVTALIFVGEALVINSKEMQNCRMKVVNVDWVLRDIVTVICLLYTSPSPRDVEECRMPSSA